MYGKVELLTFGLFSGYQLYETRNRGKLQYNITYLINRGEVKWN